MNGHGAANQSTQLRSIGAPRELVVAAVSGLNGSAPSTVFDEPSSHKAVAVWLLVAPVSTQGSSGVSRSCKNSPIYMPLARSIAKLYGFADPWASEEFIRFEAGP
jgi:hypothetical protein